MRCLQALGLLAGPSCCFAFTVVSPTGVERRLHMPVSPSNYASALCLRMSDSGGDDSAPSDTGGDDGYDDFYQYQDVVGDDDSAATASEGGEGLAASNVMDLVPSDLGESVSDETRAAINEALYKLERLNPTREPTVSPLLNGVWSLRYVGGYAPDWALPSPTRELALFLYSGGYSPGVFALGLAQKLPAALVDVGGLEISISRQQPRIEASVDVRLLGGGGESTAKVFARLEVESDVRLRETYESATLLDRNVPIPEFLRYARDLYVTYLDDDLLVVRDASGVPEVLTRNDKSFSRNWGTEPSALDDLVPPGEDA